jgi:hypothetical protein
MRGKRAPLPPDGLLRRFAPRNDGCPHKSIAITLSKAQASYLSRLENRTGDFAAIAVSSLIGQGRIAERPAKQLKRCFVVQTGLDGLLHRFAPRNDGCPRKSIAITLSKAQTRYLSRLENHTGDFTAIAVSSLIGQGRKAERPAKQLVAVLLVQAGLLEGWGDF